VVSLLQSEGGLFAPVSGGHFERFFHVDEEISLTDSDEYESEDEDNK
jgi:hypothetical protein